MKTTESKSIKVTMSLKPHVHAYATEEGRATGLGFSGYVSNLIVQDLRSHGASGAEGAIDLGKIRRDLKARLNAPANKK